MKKNISKKIDIVKEINALAVKAIMTVVIDYSHIKSLEIKYIRRALFEKHIKIKVFKNTLARKAFRNTPQESLCDFFSGPMLVIFSDEHISEPMKIINKLKSKYNEIKIKSICVYGNLFFEEHIKTLTDLPNKSDAIAKLNMCIKLPILNIANYMKSPYNKLYYLLQTLSNK